MPSVSKENFTKPEIKKDVNLRAMNTLGVESTANTFVEILDKNQLLKLADESFFEEFNPFVIGGGSNILLKSNPSRPILKVSIPGIEIRQESTSHVLVKIGAGVEWHSLVQWAVSRNFGGIENLALIPGTVGAAPIQNIGAYGVELEQVFEQLEAFLIDSKSFKTFSHDECQFGYRDSIFKRELKGKAIVTSVTLKLNKEPHLIHAEYYALKNWLLEHQIIKPLIKDVFDAVVSIRQSKLPSPSLLGNAGSFFKNPVVEKSMFENVKKRYSEMPSFPAPGGRIKIPAGWLIEQAGWKGKKEGNVGTYVNQALVIVNHGGATGEEIYEFAMRIRKSVMEKFGIQLTPEVNILE